MARKRTSKADKPTSITVPFTVLIDTNEAQSNHKGYRFEELISNVDQGSVPLVVPTQVATLGTGDYSIFGHRDIVIERKTKADFFGSMAKRDNFESRLAIMSEGYDFSAVVVEADWGEIITQPYEYSSISVKSIVRTILAWQIRYNVQWLFMPDRFTAEQCTFRLLERYWNDHRNATLNRSKLSVIAFKDGAAARLAGSPVSECPFKPQEITAYIWEQGWRWADKDIVQLGNEYPDIRLCNGSCFNARISSRGGGVIKNQKKTDIHSEFIVKKKG